MGTPRESSPEQQLRVRSSITDCGVRVIDLDGELDVWTVPLLVAALDDALAVEVRGVVIDLRAVTFIDARGLTALSLARGTVSERGAALAIVCQPAGAVERLVELTGLDATFKMYGSRSEALDAVLGPVGTAESNQQATGAHVPGPDDVQRLSDVRRQRP